MKNQFFPSRAFALISIFFSSLRTLETLNTLGNDKPSPRERLSAAIGSFMGSKGSFMGSKGSFMGNIGSPMGSKGSFMGQWPAKPLFISVTCAFGEANLNQQRPKEASV